MSRRILRRQNGPTIQTLLRTPYTGASDKNSLVDWLVPSGDADTEVLPSLPKMRDRSRDLVRNAPAATGAIGKLVSGAIGSGLVLQSSIDHKYLGLTEEQAQKWQENTEHEFRIWSESKECDFNRQLDFIGLQRLAYRSKLINGDTFVLLPMKPRKMQPYDLRIQLIEAERVVNDKDAADTDIMAGGIKRDKNGIPTGIYVRTPHPGASLYGASTTVSEWKYIPIYGEKTGRRNVIHLIDINRIGQVRGEPILSCVIDPLRQISKYSEAELTAAVINALLAVAITRPANDPVTGASLYKEYDDDGNKIEQPWERDDNMRLGSGTYLDLAPGEDIKTIAANRPSSQYDPFYLACMKQIGMGLGIPFEVLINHFSSSYSASRAALSEFFEIALINRDDFAKNFCQEAYVEWLCEAVIKGRIRAPGFLIDPMIKLAYSGAYWVGPGMKSLDELKEANASKVNMQIGTTTLQIECSKRGLYWKDVIRQRAKEKKFYEEQGLFDEYSLSYINSNPSASKEPQSWKEEDKNE